MSHVPHELAEEFPDKTDQIHDLKMNNAHFARLFDEYHTVNREIHRMEVGVEAAGEVRETEARKIRAALKDEILSMLSAN
ncbi:MAG: DUF465 domain-containing protein [Pseudomonadota bacterium]